MRRASTSGESTPSLPARRCRASSKRVRHGTGSSLETTASAISLRRRRRRPAASAARPVRVRRSTRRARRPAPGPNGRG
ncbi:MAG: hypothetical protein F4Z34_07110 [Acidimicrobiaceae bacterium]|nr:hypothetical protein [Acidimicrobiaceae bacterium]